MKNITDHDLPVRQHNAITEAKFTLTEEELNIYFAMLAQITENDQPGMWYNVRFKDIEDITGNKINNLRAKRSAENLLSKTFRFINPETGRPVKAVLAASVEAFDGGVQIEISKKLHRFLVDVKKRYTSYQLYCALSLSSKYAKRIYMLCSQWKENEITRHYEVRELREMFEIEDKVVKWSDFKRYVIDTAVDQVNKYTDLNISCKAYKTGRIYTDIQFIVKRGNPHQRIIDFNEITFSKSLSKINKAAILKHDFKLADYQIDKIINRMDWEYVSEKLEKIKEKRPGNIGAYTARILGV